MEMKEVEWKKDANETDLVSKCGRFRIQPQHDGMWHFFPDWVRAEEI
jgi:hypothetical protein